MIKFKSIYKSEYNKILDDVSEVNQSGHKITINSGHDNEDYYVFEAKAPISNTWILTTISGQTRNENERFENTLICKK